MKRALSAVWGLFIIVALLFIAGRLRRGDVLDTNLLSLLPASEGDPLLTEANDLLSQRASHLLAFVVGHPDPDKAADLGRRLNAELAQSPFVSHSLTEIPPDQQKAFYTLYFPFRYQMLSPQDRETLQSGKALPAFAQRLTEALYSPASSFFKELIPRDPFLFFPELIRSWMATAVPKSAQGDEGIAFVDQDGRSYAFAAVELSLDPFNSKNQDRMMADIQALRSCFLAEDPQTRIYGSGVLPFATAERLRTEREMQWVSLGSLVGVLLITGFIFASPRAIVLAALPIAIGFVMAMAATIFCFGKIHMITLAFGSSLIGVAIDYPVLYLAHHRMAGGSWNSQRGLQRVIPGILLGALTTLLGYAALSLAPFPGLRQMALFSSAGLASALVTVLLWLPHLLARATTRITPLKFVLWEERFFTVLLWNSLSLDGSRERAGVRATSTGLHPDLLPPLRSGEGAYRVLNPAMAFFLLGFFLIFIIGGLARLHADDDIRRLQRPSAALARENAFVQRAMKGFGDSRFVLVRGNSLEELLERQEALQDRLLSLVATGTLTSVQSLAPFLPSLQRQRADHALLQQSLLSDPSAVRRALNGVGLAPSIAQGFLHDLRRPMTFFPLDEWLRSPASQLLRTLWIGSTAHGFASAVLISGNTDSNILIPLLKNLPGVRFFDQVEEYSNLFQRYRHLSVGLMVLAYVVVWLLMIGRYGLKGGTLVTAPSVGAIVFTFALFGWCGVAVNLIHSLSALLVLSMGIDYTIYFAEAARAGMPAAPTFLAVTLCACTALLSFGLLALCRTPVLSAIGMTVFFGMAVAFFFAPFPYLMRKSSV